VALQRRWLAFSSRSDLAAKCQDFTQRSGRTYDSDRRATGAHLSICRGFEATTVTETVLIGPSRTRPQVVLDGRVGDVERPGDDARGSGRLARVPGAAASLKGLDDMSLKDLRLPRRLEARFFHSWP
jgi:hypothetical protein